MRKNIFFNIFSVGLIAGFFCFYGQSAVNQDANDTDYEMNTTVVTVQGEEFVDVEKLANDSIIKKLSQKNNVLVQNNEGNILFILDKIPYQQYSQQQTYCFYCCNDRYNTPCPLQCSSQIPPGYCGQCCLQTD